MSREEEGEPPDRTPPPAGVLRPTPLAVLAAWVAVGAVVGWLVHPLGERLTGTAPILTWPQVLLFWVAAPVLGAVAWTTWRTVQVHRAPIPAQQAVNRLALARASSYLGAVVGGGFLGYAASWVGIDAELADQRMWRGFVGAGGGLALVATAVWLERACRVRSEDPES